MLRLHSDRRAAHQYTATARILKIRCDAELFDEVERLKAVHRSQTKCPASQAAVVLRISADGVGDRGFLRIVSRRI